MACRREEGDSIVKKISNWNMMAFQLDRCVPFVWLWDVSYTSASANASRAGTSEAFMRLQMVTTGATMVTVFIFSIISRITRAALGAHEPFSTIPKVRF